VTEVGDGRRLEGRRTAAAHRCRSGSISSFAGFCGPDEKPASSEGDWDSLCASHHPTTRTLDQDRTAPNRKSRMSVKLSMLHRTASQPTEYTTIAAGNLRKY
jgi:hypothetical protein